MLLCRTRGLAACLAASLGLVVVAAQAAPASLPAFEGVRGDDLILAARDPARQGDVDRLGLISRRLQTTDPGHPLLAYPEYWALNIRLKRALDGVLDSVPDAVVRDFLARNEGSVVADLARRDWLLVLGKRRDFVNLDVEFPRFALNDDAQVSCYALLSRHIKQENVVEQARLALSQPRDMGDGCHALAVALSTDNRFEADQIWAWVRNAFDANALSAARRYASLLPTKEAPAPATLDAVYDRTASWLTRSGSAASNRLNRQLVTLALVRLARNDPEQYAGIYKRTWAPVLPVDLRATVWSQLAAAGAKKFLPQVNDWSTLGLTAKYLSEETLAWQARGALRALDWRLLKNVIEKMPPEMRQRSGDGTWSYWLARTLKNEGKLVEANALFRSIADQYHFYGQLALEELGERIVVPVSGGPVTEAELTTVKALPGLARSQRFYQIGMRAPGNLEWNFTLRGMSDRQLLAAADFARRSAILDRAVNTADRTRSEHDFATRFLAPYREQLQAKTDALGLDLAWVYGLIRQESRFLSSARSSVGASGLMQVMPATARYVARRIGFDMARSTDEADTNLLLGTNYLRMVLADLDNSPVLATAAYNAGPSRSRNWRSTLSKPVEGAIFAETIPFNETRDYVKKVMSNAVYYAALFEGKSQSLRARIGIIAPKGYVESTLP